MKDIRKLDDASYIKLDPKLGTQVLCQNSANKLALLNAIVASSNELRNFIKSSGVMSKMKKRTTQASKSSEDSQLIASVSKVF